MLQECKLQPREKLSSLAEGWRAPQLRLGVPMASEDASAVHIRVDAAPSKMRSDLDGLRGLAVLAIIVFHINSTWLPGGFAGVDGEQGGRRCAPRV